MNTGTNEEQPIEIEEFAKSLKPVPAGRVFIIRVDKQKITVHAESLTGREILALVGKNPEQTKLFEHIRGQQPVEIHADQRVHFTSPGIERFSTLARDTTEGC